MKKIFAILALSALVSGVGLYAQPAPGAGDDKPGAPRHEQLRNEQKQPQAKPAPAKPEEGKGRNTFSERVKADAEKLHAMYDFNKDGVIDEAEHKKMDEDFEIAKRLQPYVRTKQIIDAVDKDRDLRISDSEAKAIRQAGRQQMRDRKTPPARPADAPKK